MIEPLLSLSGFRVIVDDFAMSTTKEDWSEVRSPSRARRRMRRGFRQNVRWRRVPKSDVMRMGDTLVMHSEIYRMMKEQVDALD